MPNEYHSPEGHQISSNSIFIHYEFGVLVQQAKTSQGQASTPHNSHSPIWICLIPIQYLRHTYHNFKIVNNTSTNIWTELEQTKIHQQTWVFHFSNLIITFRFTQWRNSINGATPNSSIFISSSLVDHAPEIRDSCTGRDPSATEHNHVACLSWCGRCWCLEMGKWW